MNPVQRLASVIRMALRDVEALTDAGHIDILLTGFEDDIRKIRKKLEYGQSPVPISSGHAIASHLVNGIRNIRLMERASIDTRRAALVEIHATVHATMDSYEMDSD